MSVVNLIRLYTSTFDDNLSLSIPKQSLIGIDDVTAGMLESESDLAIADDRPAIEQRVLDRLPFCC